MFSMLCLTGALQSTSCIFTFSTFFNAELQSWYIKSSNSQQESKVLLPTLCWFLIVSETHASTDTDMYMYIICISIIYIYLRYLYFVYLIHQLASNLSKTIRSRPAVLSRARRLPSDVGFGRSSMLTGVDCWGSPGWWDGCRTVAS